MNLTRSLVLSGALALSAGAALADSTDVSRIQEGIRDAQRPAAVLQEGRSSAVGAPQLAEQPSVAAQNTNANGPRTSDPIYFQQANGRQNR
jgi:hypothetical protein